MAPAVVQASTAMAWTRAFSATTCCITITPAWISLYAVDGAHGSSNNKVYNNTIVMAPNSRFVINIPNDGGGKKPPVGNIIENNILYTPDAGHGSILVAKAGVTGFRSDYNIVVNVFSINDDAS